MNTSETDKTRTIRGLAFAGIIFAVAIVFGAVHTISGGGATITFNLIIALGLILAGAAVVTRAVQVAETRELPLADVQDSQEITHGSIASSNQLTLAEASH